MERVEIQSVRTSVMLVFCVLSGVNWPIASTMADNLTSRSLTSRSKTDEPSTAQIEKWIRQLDARQFAVRESATSELIKSGGASLSMLVDSLKNARLERTARIVYVLREISLSPNFTDALAAHAVLRELSEQPKATAASRRAARALADIGEFRQKSALEELEQLGAVISHEDDRISTPSFFHGLTVEINDQWKGSPKDFERLKWLVGAQRVVLVGDKVNDAALKYVGQMPDLKVVTVKRAPITSEGIAYLAKLTQIRHIEIMYAPVTDDIVEPLTKLRTASLIKMFGTRVTKDGAKRLQAALQIAHIDHRQGAFLGVGAVNAGLGCQVSTVHPGSSADRAGLIRGDIILRYNMKKIEDFDGLTEAIGENAVGDTVTLEILRGGQLLEKKVTLGQWG